MVSGRIMQYAVVWLCVSTVAVSILPSKEEQLARVCCRAKKVSRQPLQSEYNTYDFRLNPKALSSSGIYFTKVILINFYIFLIPKPHNGLQTQNCCSKHNQLPSLISLLKTHSVLSVYSHRFLWCLWLEELHLFLPTN